MSAYRAIVVQKKLTITVDDEVYQALYRVIGRHRISRFIEDLVRPHVVPQGLTAAYREMAADEEREAEAQEWAEATVGDVSDENAVRCGGSTLNHPSVGRSRSSVRP